MHLLLDDVSVAMMMMMMMMMPDNMLTEMASTLHGHEAKETSCNKLDSVGSPCCAQSTKSVGRFPWPEAARPPTNETKVTDRRSQSSAKLTKAAGSGVRGGPRGRRDQGRHAPNRRQLGECEFRPPLRASSAGVAITPEGGGIKGGVRSGDHPKSLLGHFKVTQESFFSGCPFWKSPCGQ